MENLNNISIYICALDFILSRRVLFLSRIRELENFWLAPLIFILSRRVDENYVRIIRELEIFTPTVKIQIEFFRI